MQIGCRYNHDPIGQKTSQGLILPTLPVVWRLGDIVFQDFFYCRPWCERSSCRRLLWWPPTFPNTASTLLLIKADWRRLARSQSPVMQADVSSDKARLCLTAMKWVIKACLSKLIYCTLFISMSRGTLVFVRCCVPSWFFPPASCLRWKAPTAAVGTGPRSCTVGPPAKFNLFVPLPSLCHYGYATYRKRSHYAVNC